MTRSIVNSRTRVRELGKTDNRRQVFGARLAEDYDGIGQYVLVALSRGTTGAAYKARVASGDFGTGQVIPFGTPVSVFSNRGILEIISMGAK